ncbi:MAG: MBL fold metallo-hydrolase [Deltaproteobacteria bacterium]|nr:MBL fold metallo-hydrolase [Deltaproteobacteria bacterium]
MKLTLINHACCKAATGSFAILFDPWTDGPAFNFGWDLLVPTPVGFREIMSDVSYIWISHEHPDHFSIPFLTKVAADLRDKVTVLFQKTRDGRVVSFCRSLGLQVQELLNHTPTELGDNVTVTCGAFDFYDSWVYLDDGQNTILNLNDCPMGTERDLRAVKRLTSKPTVLLSQFSYAAWQGGRGGGASRSIAAREKLNTLELQVRCLQPKYAVPFASLMYFSNEENRHLNDAVNTPRDAAEAINQAGSRPIILYPGDSWQIEDENWDNTGPLGRYERCYGAIGNLPVRAPGPSSSFNELAAAFQRYQQRVFSKNSRALILLLSWLPILGAFRPLRVRLYDIDLLLSVSVVHGLTKLSRASCEPPVIMHSGSLLFLFKNEFGFDTLTVNGRFEATPNGFATMTRALAVGSLNSMGLSISPALLLNPRVVLSLLRQLRGMLRRLRQRNKPE